MSNHTLLIGYGNPDREDDGVAWHILRALTVKLGLLAPASYEDEFPQNAQVDFAFYLQLTPEMAEEISAYDYVCFVDAHTGNVPEDVQLISITAQFQTSPFTHHMTAATCLTLAETIYHHFPEAILVSVRGYQFGFTRTLSPETEALAGQAANRVLEWLLNKN